MRSVLVAFAILLAILLSISALGGSLNVSERFYEDMLEEQAEAFYQDKEEPENFYQDSASSGNPLQSTGPTAPTAPDAMPAVKEEYYEEEGEAEGEGEVEEGQETIEPFEDDNTYMPY